MCIARQILIAAQFPLHTRHGRFILHKIGHFQPFLKIELSKKFSWGPPFAIMPKRTDFSCLGNELLRSVGSVACSILALFFNCLIRAFVAAGSQWRGSRRWPATDFQKVP